ncbi:hypothetical protein GF371_00720 [Candidatus Woesearchaeota archaeon]|nr:hypothetical protein [Candidatus Woesearchaeota archaeon]
MSMKRIVVICLFVILLISVTACQKTPEEKYREFSEEIVNEFGKELATEQAYIGQSIDREKKVMVYENLFELNNASLEKAGQIEVPERYAEAHEHLLSALRKMADYYAGAAFFQNQWIQIEADLENLNNQLESGWVDQSRVDYYNEQKVVPQEERADVLLQLKTDAQADMNKYLEFLEKT